MRRAGNARGMTLVELMIVVVIIGILAAISVVGYRKYVARARLSEATAILAEFAAKEQLYFLDNGQFMEAHRSYVYSPGTSAPYPSTNESASDFWPSDPSGAFDSVRAPVDVNPVPDAWRRLGIRPRWNQLYCTYLANAGSPASAPPGSVGPTLWGAAPNVPWFYALAVCNLGGVSGWPNSGGFNQVTVMSLTHDSPAIRTIDESR